LGHWPLAVLIPLLRLLLQRQLAKAASGKKQTTGWQAP